ncbi:MAG: OmpA family protein [Hydrogenophaga sp.]|nr:OmpA family protein [Hydrogenophaga sp.]
MKTSHLIALSAVALAVLAGCSSVPKGNAQLEQARTDYRAVQADPRAQSHAGTDMKLASDAMSQANAAWGRDEDEARVNHLAYLASQRVAIVRETMNMKTAEAMVASAGADRTQVQLQARTQQADAAQRSASAAQQAATAAEVQAATAERNAAAAQRSTELARSESAQAQQQTQLAMERNRQLETQLKELNAQQTPRGLVVTLGDVLYDVNRAELKPGGLRKVDQLVAVLNEFPQRNVLVEGFTDSTGADSHNLVLSGQRADAVRTALLRQGIDSARVTARGYGESSPVSSNASAAGRQMNRRVEIVLSDDSGRTVAR